MTDKPKTQIRIGDFDVSEVPLGKAISQFVGGVENIPKAPPPAPATPKPTPTSTSTPVDDVMSTPVESVEDILKPEAPPEQSLLERTIDAAKKSAEMTYPERLAGLKITMEEARKIIDAILTHGEYLRTYAITPRYSVTFRTRDVRGNNVTLEVLEDKHPGYDVSIANHVTRHNLAQSIAAIGPKDKLDRFPKSDEGFDQALRFVDRLPGPVFNLLVTKLRKFDELVLTVMDEGAIQNF